MNAAAGPFHYDNASRFERRSVTAFDPLRYAPSNTDVATAFGFDTSAITAHYITDGVRQGRATASFDPVIYAASNLDVARFYGAGNEAEGRHRAARG